MLQADSIHTISSTGVGDSAQHVHRPLTPAQILSWLPKDATPAQQDSAIQRYMKPKEIHWSQRPDTLHLPGMPIGRSIYDMKLQTSYKDNFFSEHPMYHPELKGGRMGTAGDPVPYTIAGDNLMTSILLGCLILTPIAISKAGKFLTNQIKSFLYVQRGLTTDINETGADLGAQIIMAIETSLLLSLIFFGYIRGRMTDDFFIEPYLVIALYTGIIIVYFMLKFMIQRFTGWLFFDSKNNEQWDMASLFLAATEGVVILPLALLHTYFNVSATIIGICAIIVIILFKILAFYKCYLIFFRKMSFSLQIILYLCTLEIAPLVALWSCLLFATECLKVNF